MTDRVDPEWIRGVLPFLVLSALAEGPSHGYAIALRLETNGLAGLRTGTIYPVLNRLEGQDLVEATWLPGEGGPGRKAYALTADGRRHLASQRSDWLLFTDRVTRATTQEDPA